jgi:signal transduction histidine kinase
VPDDEGFTGYNRELLPMITARADDLRSAADVRQVWFSVLAGLALAVAVTVTLLVSRSLTRPLRSLTRQAKDMAEHGLPEAVLDILDTPLGDDVRVPHLEPVAVTTRDEVADVAAALSSVHRSALELAVEQAALRRNIADSFVNLGRRNQNLLTRQLDFITELESDETDPDTLASLFRLDHLATRMRRNAESLLLLAGIDPPRKWAEPVPLTDVIRAALGEVEDYQRVDVQAAQATTVAGWVAADLAHLLAELIENALAYSSPDQRVEVRGRFERQRGGYELVVIDTGLGMSDADLARANRRLAGTESFTVAPSKYLGHYVAGHLAARHGIDLHLGRTHGRGVTASIHLPARLLAQVPGPGVDASPSLGGSAAPPVTFTAAALPAPPPPAMPAGPLLAALDDHVTRLGTAPVATAAPPPGPPPTAPLPRRVRGAQLPTTQPVPLRRAPGPGPAAAPGAGVERAPAQDVYGFLQGFAGGVQRGLDEARRIDRPPPYL